MPFDMGSAVETKEKKDGTTETKTSFDWGSAQESKDPQRTEVIEPMKEKKENFFDSLGKIFKQSPEQQSSRAQNAYAISQATGIPLHEVSEKYDDLIHIHEITGMKTGDTRLKTIINEYSKPLIGASLLVNPIETVAGLATFTALDKLIPTEKFLPSDANNPTKTAIELVDFIAKGALAGGIYKGTLEAFSKSKISELGLPATIKMTGEHFSKLKEGLGEKWGSFLDSLGLSKKEESAAKQGVLVNVPMEKLVQASDHLEQVKNIVGDKRGFDAGIDKFVAEEVKPFMNWAKETGVKALDIMRKSKDGITNIFYPANKVIEKEGKEAYAEVIRAVHTPEAEILGFNNQKSENFDGNFKQLEKFFDGFPDKDLRDFNLTRGEAQSASAQQLQADARTRLSSGLKSDNLPKAIKESSDYVFQYAKQNGIDLNYFEDYFFGAYKNDKGQVENFMDYWMSTEKYSKEKTFPTIADADAFGLELKNNNPISNIKSEMRLVAQRVGLKQLRESLESEGRNFFIKPDGATPEEMKGWRKIEDPVFKGLLFAPEYAKFVNSLLSTNKVSSNLFLKGLRQLSFTARQIKFFGSVFHLGNMGKFSVAESNVWNPEGYADIFKSFKPIEETDPKYKEYVNLGGGHKYSLDVQAQKQINTLVDKMKKGNYLGGLLRVPSSIAEQEWIPASPGNIKWMFNEFIPKLKFVKYLKDDLEKEENLGRPTTDSEKIDTIKRIQNMAGEMNERLFGRSSTVTSASRLIFSAPGYGEGNFLNIFESMKEVFDSVKAKSFTPEGFKNTHFIASSLFTTLCYATLGTYLMTGQAPKIPTNGNEVRDLFKIKTGQKDGNGDDVFFDLMTYDKDAWSIYGNMAIGSFGKIPQDLKKRISGMIGTPFRLLTDLSTIATGGLVYDFKGQPIYRKTDEFTDKVKKFMQYEGMVAQPISLSVLGQTKQKGVDWLQSIAVSITGMRSSTSETVKELKAARADMFSLQDAKREKQNEMNKLFIESPEEAKKEVASFNSKQAKALSQIMKKFGIERFGKKKDMDLYFINNVRGRTVGKGSEELLRGMFKKTRILSPKTKIQTGEDKANIEKIFKENFQ